VIEPVHHGTLFARDPGVRSHPPWGHEYPLPITKLGVDVVIENQVARVAIDQTFHNASDQNLEGVFRFAIPPDAALQRLAMYVDGKLEESAVVERMQARRIYEQLVYRRIDPALLEWEGTGRLSLRVYPIPARQDKRLVMAYTQSLAKLYDDYTVTVPLPEVDQQVGELAISMRVHGCASCELSSTSHQIDVRREGDDAVVSYRATADKLADSFVLHVRDPRHATVVATHVDGADRYLLVRASAALPGGALEYRPRTWVLLDDVSASRSALELRAQQDLIEAFLRELDEDDRVAVVAFDVEARTKLPPTRVRDIDRKAVREALRSEGRVGATDLSAALAAATQLLAGTRSDDAMIIYLGDGVITSGARELDKLRAQLAGKAKFVGVGVGDGPDIQTLDALAGATGGYATTIDLADDIAWRAFDLVAALHTQRATAIEARLVGAAGELVPATAYLRSPQLADGEEIELVAKLAGAGAPVAVELTGTRAGAPWHQRVALPASAHDGGYVPRLWAQRHIAARLLAKHEPVAVAPCARQPCPSEDQLRDARDEVIRKEIVALGKRYFLLSRHTSLLVLENDAMYQQFGVTKGAGDTWAPYRVPATIPSPPVTASGVSSASVDRGAVVVRSPFTPFYQPGAAKLAALRGDRFAFVADETGVWAGEEEFGGDRLRTLEATSTPRLKLDEHKDDAEDETVGALAGKVGTKEADREKVSLPVSNATAGPIPVSAATDELVATTGMVVSSSPHRGGGGFASHGIDAPWSGQALYLQHFTYAGDPAFDDVTAFAPALSADPADAWRSALELDVGHVGAHAVDDAARELLARARRELPSGVYRWGDLELAVDAARRIGWRRITEDGLAETASFDGKTWLRRYGELGLDATRAVDADDLAFALAYLPVWIAAPEHYARWFDVTARGHEVALSRAVQGKARTLLVLVFDDRAHLIAVRDSHGAAIYEITWSAAGPTAARAGGEAVTVGFTPEAIADAATWAHGSSQPGVAIELPMRSASFWQKRADAEPAGTPAWRYAQRQRMASLAAMPDRAALYAGFEQLRTHGGIELGDLALASAGLMYNTASLDPALKPMAKLSLAQYVAACHAFLMGSRNLIAPTSRDGFIGALWSLRASAAHESDPRSALGQALAIHAGAPRLRVVAAMLLSTRWDVVDATRAWDALAGTRYANLAQVQIAQALANRGDSNGAAERLATLAASYDLRALPSFPQYPQNAFQAARRGSAGWQLIWTQWRDRVLAGDSFAHVQALLPLAAQRPADVPVVLARAVQLAGPDVVKQVAVARSALAYGQRGWAERLLEPLANTAPSRDVYQLLAAARIADGKLEGALAALEAAQGVDLDGPADIEVVRAELGQILWVAEQLAMQSSGAPRAAAIRKALAWGDRWRTIDPGNTQIDTRLGHLLLAAGDAAGAWRQLSSVIERDPWSGEGYMAVAATFEEQGKAEAALPYWDQAIRIDQTNPTPRLRKAQVLIALGRTGEGDALLREIARGKWHDVWSNIVYQANDLLARGQVVK
jgi:hypothetical protein